MKQRKLILVSILNITGEDKIIYIHVILELTTSRRILSLNGSPKLLT